MYSSSYTGSCYSQVAVYIAINPLCLGFHQELEKELAEQKDLLRSVASRGEEILTQHSTPENLCPRCSLLMLFFIQ